MHAACCAVFLSQTPRNKQLFGGYPCILPQRTAPHFAPFLVRMEAAGLPDLFIKSFAHYYDQLVDGTYWLDSGG